MNVGEILTQALPWATVLGGAVAWIYDKRARRADTDKKRSDAVEGISALYNKMVEDTDKEFEEMRKQIAGLKEDIQKLKEEIRAKDEIIEQMQQEEKKKSRRIAELEREIEQIKK